MQSFFVSFRQARAFRYSDFAKGVPFVPYVLSGMEAWRLSLIPHVFSGTPTVPPVGDYRGEDGRLPFTATQDCAMKKDERCGVSIGM